MGGFVRIVLGVSVNNDSHYPATIKLRRLDPDIPVPQRAHRGDAGVDLSATTDVIIHPGERLLVVGLVHPRSGLAARHGLSIVNAPGTIDADYRGEIKVCLINLDPSEPFVIKRGDRIAQLVVQKVELVDFEEVDELDTTERGEQGYGSSGI